MIGDPITNTFLCIIGALIIGGLLVFLSEDEDDTDY